MALDALFHQTDAGINAADMRRLVNAFAGGREGILNYGDFAGSATSTTNFRVVAGIGIVGHDSSSIERFLISSTAVADQTITAPGSGTKSITVYARVQDATLGDGSNAVTITKSETTNGTFGIPSGESGIELYRITLPSGNTLISGATITDVRAYAKPWNVPWGVVGVGERRSTYGPLSGVSQEAAVLGLGTVTIVTGRLYRVTMQCRATVTTTGRWVLSLRNDDGSVQYHRTWDGATQSIQTLSTVHVLTAADLGGAGSRIYEMWAATTTDTNSVTLSYSATSTSGPAHSTATIEDIGPAANF